MRRQPLGVGALGTGDAVGMTLAGGPTFTAGPGGAEILVREMTATLG